jgi:hypothetical protein
MESCSVAYLWRNAEATESFRSGVSLHSHTNESRETLRFLATVGCRYSLMRCLMHRLERRSEANHGMRVDYEQSYWTPPMPPKLAFDLECGQIEQLGLAPMVSITDHDSIQATLLLQTVRPEQHAPISVEWTVPYGTQSFHLGVHNLPRATAVEWAQILAAYTARPSQAQLREILAALHAEPSVLVVFNHPMWDLYQVGAEQHVRLVDEFLRENSSRIHAIELNGLRNWKENREAMRLARKWKMILISGGDRHGIEPNANVNLTNATCFEEFVREIREDRRSTVLFMPQYAQPWKHRILRSAIDAVRHYPHFPAGSREWDERVYHPDRNGVLHPLRALWPDGTAPRAMRWGIAMVQLLGTGVLSGGLRVAWSDAHELTLALEQSEV